MRMTLPRCATGRRMNVRRLAAVTCRSSATASGSMIMSGSASAWAASWRARCRRKSSAALWAMRNSQASGRAIGPGWDSASIALTIASWTTPLNAQPKAPEVMVANPVLKRIVRWDEYTGQFEAVRRVEVRARVSGELVKIHFTDGQTVKAGDILFTIDPRPFVIAVEDASAAV